MNKHKDTIEFVKDRYGQAARTVLENNQQASCCKKSGTDPITADLYEKAQASEVPAEALLASLGCGNPVALAELNEGETVLDLGSGGGIDVLLSARRVGSTGKAYGLDMTDEMLELARQNKQKSGIENAEFLKGHIENIPLPDNSVDVILSNCVINLSGDKDAVFQEAFRVLKPGGRFAVADIVTRQPLPEAVVKNIDFWSGCVGGALQDSEYKQKLETAGFRDVSLESVRTYNRDRVKELLSGNEFDAAIEAVADQVSESLYSAFIRARKPE